MAIDIIIAILIIVAVVTGAIRGLVRQLGTLVAFIVAILACRFFAPGLAQTGAWTLPLGTVLRHPAPGLCVCVGVHRGFPFGEPYSQTAARHRERAQPQPARPCGRSHFPRGTVDSNCKRMPQRLFPARATEPFRLSRQFPPVESMDIESRSRDRGLYREPINRAERY